MFDLWIQCKVDSLIHFLINLLITKINNCIKMNGKNRSRWYRCWLITKKKKKTNKLVYYFFIFNFLYYYMKLDNNNNYNIVMVTATNKRRLSFLFYIFMMMEKTSYFLCACRHTHIQTKLPLFWYFSFYNSLGYNNVVLMSFLFPVLIVCNSS